MRSVSDADGTLHCFFVKEQMKTSETGAAVTTVRSLLAQLTFGIMCLPHTSCLEGEKQHNLPAPAGNHGRGAEAGERGPGWFGDIDG